MKYVLLLFSFVILITYSCTKKEKLIGDTYVSLAYKQTYCSDKWMNSSEDSLTLKNVGHYLDSLNLYIAGITIKQDAQAESCFACFCKTGKTIYVTTFDNDAMKAKYLAIGFK